MNWISTISLTKNPRVILGNTVNHLIMIETPTAKHSYLLSALSHRKIWLSRENDFIFVHSIPQFDSFIPTVAFFAGLLNLYLISRVASSIAETIDFKPNFDFICKILMPPLKPMNKFFKCIICL